MIEEKSGIQGKTGVTICRSCRVYGYILKMAETTDIPSGQDVFGVVGELGN